MHAQNEGEELFARLRSLASYGIWDGVDPLLTARGGGPC